MYHLDLGLQTHGYVSDTLKRVCNSLESFAKGYTEYFITFANTENELKASTPKPKASMLKRQVGPLIDFEARLKVAMQDAADEVAAWDLESMSQSLRESQRKKEVKVVKVEKEDPEVDRKPTRVGNDGE